jgi:hypothetical protein
MKTVFDLLKVARNGASELGVEFGASSPLQIPAEPKEPSGIDVKPNPLFLLASFDEKGTVEFNREPTGSIKDLSVIGSKMRDIFRSREKNGVFREDSYEIEKSVFVRVPETARFGEATAFAKALADAGAEPLWLAIEKIVPFEERLEITDLDLILPRVKPKGDALPSSKPKPRPKRKPNK